MNFKKLLSLVLVFVLCFSVFSGCGENKNPTDSATTPITNANPEKTIVVVGENENLGFGQSFKNGAEEAAKKYGYKLSYMGTDEGAENISSSHIASLEKALNEKISGIVIAPEGEGYSGVYGKIYDKKIPVVQIDGLSEDEIEKIESNKKNPVVSTISTSYKAAGAACAEKVFERVKEDIKKSDNTYVIGVIERDNASVDNEKAQGFTEKFTELADADSQTKGKYKIETESEDKYEDSFEALLEENVKVVFMTHSSIADKISDIVFADESKYNKMIFCGFDSGAKQIKWLGEKNVEFIGAVAQDAYNLGYNAVEQCVFSVEGKEVKEVVEIQGQWYDKSNVEKLKQDNIIFEK